MSERPILFSAQPVRATLEGRKTQTRRVVKPQTNDTVALLDQLRAMKAPWFPGVRLWVRETFVLEWPEMDRPEDEEEFRRWVIPHYAATEPRPHLVDQNTERPIGWRPSIFMPRWASRITLEVTEVRVERLQDISEEDAKAEGVEQTTSVGPCRAMGWRGGPGMAAHMRAVPAFQDLWTSINGPGSWEANPWVWAISFKRVDAKERAA